MCLESNCIPARDARRAQTKPFVHRDPVAPQRFECLSVSCRSTGQQWLATVAGPLTSAALDHTVLSTRELLSRHPQTAYVLYQGNSHTAKTVLGSTTGFLTWIWRRDGEPPGSLTLEASGVYSQNFHRTREADFWRAQTKPCAHQEPGEKISVPTGE